MFDYYRRHPQPLEHAFDELREILAKRGFSFAADTSKDLTDTLNSINVWNNKWKKNIYKNKKGKEKKKGKEEKIDI